MSEAKIKKFSQEDGTKAYDCGQKSVWDWLFKKSCIKNLEGKVLYEGRGSFQTVLEKAVKEGVELPRADLSNQKFRGLFIPKAKIPGASFENSAISVRLRSMLPEISYLNGSDLTKVNFKNLKVDGFTNFTDCNVEGADFKGVEELTKTLGFPSMFNFDKALNVTADDLEYWHQEQPKALRSREKEQSKKINPFKLIKNNQKTH